MSVQDFMKDNRFGIPKANLLGGGKKYNAKDNFPDLSKHNNVMASHLTFEVSETIFSTTFSDFPFFRLFAELWKLDPFEEKVVRGVTTKICKMATLAKMSKEQFAKENYPDLSKHNNIMASNLTFEVSQTDYSLQQGF